MRLFGEGKKFRRMVGIYRLLTESPVDFFSMGPGNGDELVADISAMLTDPVHSVERKGIGAVYAGESFRGQTGREIGKRQVHDINPGLRNDPYIVPEAFDIEQGIEIDADPLIVGAKEKGIFFIGGSRLLQGSGRLFHGL